MLIPAGACLIKTYDITIQSYRKAHTKIKVGKIPPPYQANFPCLVMFLIFQQCEYTR